MTYFQTSANFWIEWTFSKCLSIHRTMNFIRTSTLVTIFAVVRYIYADTNSNITIDCTQNNLLVTGNTISIAEVIKTAQCWHQATQIDIFGLSKVIFDEDIDKQGQHVNMSIFAPTWEIISPSTNNQVQRKVLFNASFGFNFFATSLRKINAGPLHFQIDGDTRRLRKFNFDGKHPNESKWHRTGFEVLNSYFFSFLQVVVSISWVHWHL